jgi:hypothetical protein
MAFKLGLHRRDQGVCTTDCAGAASSGILATTTPTSSVAGSNPSTIVGPNTTQLPSSPGATNTNASNTPNVNPVPQTGVSKGAVAGVAIGCAIVGAAVAGLIVFLLLRRRNNRQQRPIGYAQHLGPQNGAFASQEKSDGSLSKGAVVVSVTEKYLPQPVEDDAIKGEMSKLRDRIKNHAQSYYHVGAVNPSVVEESKFQGLSRSSGIPTAAIREMLLNPASRITAIRMYLAWEIMSRCLGSTASALSLLPPEVSNFAGLLANSNNTDAGKTTCVRISGLY